MVRTPSMFVSLFKDSVQRYGNPISGVKVHWHRKHNTCRRASRSKLVFFFTIGFRTLFLRSSTSQFHRTSQRRTQSYRYFRAQSVAKLSIIVILATQSPLEGRHSSNFLSSVTLGYRRSMPGSTFKGTLVPVRFAECTSWAGRETCMSRAHDNISVFPISPTSLSL